MRRLVSILAGCLLVTTLAALAAANLDRLLSGQGPVLLPDPGRLLAQRRPRELWLLLTGAGLLLLAWMALRREWIQYKSGTRQILPGLSTPLPAGEGQHGTAHWLPRKEYAKVWQALKVDPLAPRLQTAAAQGAEGWCDDVPEVSDTPGGATLSAPPSGGVVLGWDRHMRQLYYAPGDTHTFVLGATRSGKSRCLVLPSIALTGLAGESVVAVDIKGELAAYTGPFLQRQGYEVILINFDQPRQSARYNFLQPCIDATNLGDLPQAVTKAREVATILIPDAKNTDPVWQDGARSVLVMAILAVVLENQKRPELQNLANAREFIARMCRSVGSMGELPLTQYLAELPEDHPVGIAMGIAAIAPAKMRGSFYTQALTALDVFTDPVMHDLTAATDFDIYATGQRRRAIFLVVPDLPKTYHPLASLFVLQHYQTMLSCANRNGGRLQRRVEFFLDEFGNFTRIPDFDTMLTVGGGRGMRFHLFLQATTQLDDKYGDKVGRTIRANCETWVYLQSDELATREELSRKLGTYTIKSSGMSGSSTGSSSASYNLISRPLLTSDEISRINRPWQLVTSRAAPAIMYAPDLSKTICDRLYGTGNPEHNRELILRRIQELPEREIHTHYWTGWKKYEAAILAADPVI